MRVAIADQNLVSFAGHYWEYNATVSQILKNRGCEVVILAAKKAQGLPAGANIAPCFTYTSADIARPEWYRRARAMLGGVPLPLIKALRHVYRGYKKRVSNVAVSGSSIPSFGVECVEAIKRLGLGAGDAFFIPTIHAEELLSLAEALQKTSDPMPRIMLVLRREPEEAAMMRLPQALSAIPMQYRAQFLFYADTPPLAEAYARQFGLNVEILPIPYDLALIRKSVVPNTSGKAKRIVYLGNARQEKGFHLLPAMVADVSMRDPAIAFHIQCSMAKEDEIDPVIAGAIHMLKRYRNVALHEAPLSQEEYIDLLALSDIVLLPYDASKYKRRSSGILAQAQAAGKVAVVPKGAWFGDMAEGVVRFNAGELSNAVKEAIENFPALKTAAEKQAAGMSDETLENAFYNALFVAAGTRKTA
jgi:glycosyltransferase involved in cell wall biosynthesis